MKWRTKEGVLIPIEKMDTSHLQNTIRFLDKKLNAFKEDLFRVPHDPSSYHIDDLVDMYLYIERKREEHRVQRYAKIKGAMQHELQKRQPVAKKSMWEELHELVK